VNYYFYERFKENLNLIYGVCINFIWFDIVVQLFPENKETKMRFVKLFP